MAKRRFKLKKYYVIFVGACPGIYESWEDVLRYVENYSKPVFRKYYSRKAAEAAFYSRSQSRYDPEKTFKWTHPQLKKNKEK